MANNSEPTTLLLELINQLSAFLMSGMNIAAEVDPLSNFEPSVNILM